MPIFENNGKIYIINKLENEEEEIFSDRVQFIISQEPTKEILDKIIIYSRMYINTKYYGCKYNDSIDSEITQMIEKMNK